MQSNVFFPNKCAFQKKNKEDVRRLHMCPTLASMRRLWSLLYLSWVAMGEKDVAEWFNDYVMKDGDFTQNFYYVRRRTPLTKQTPSENLRPTMILS